jgi:hypothetical protein
MRQSREPYLIRFKKKNLENPFDDGVNFDHYNIITFTVVIFPTHSTRKVNSW